MSIGGLTCMPKDSGIFFQFICLFSSSCIFHYFLHLLVLKVHMVVSCVVMLPMPSHRIPFFPWDLCLLWLTVCFLMNSKLSHRFFIHPMSSHLWWVFLEFVDVLMLTRCVNGSYKVSWFLWVFIVPIFSWFLDVLLVWGFTMSEVLMCLLMAKMCCLINPSQASSVFSWLLCIMALSSFLMSSWIL